MPEGRVIARIRDEASQIARGWSGPEASPTWQLTASLFQCLADDAELLALAAVIPPDRLPPLLFAATVHRVAARHREEPFAAYFPVPEGDQPPLDHRFAGRYRAFCLEHRDELSHLQSERLYQMNEVARCTQVALALGVLTRRLPGRELALVDMGTGSGLGLYLDRYRYTMSDGRRWGPADSPVHIDCELHGPLRPRLPPAPAPAIRHRVGIDLNPLDLDDPEERAWLTACAPPEIGALERLAGAIDVARSGHAPIVRGPADVHLSEVLGAVPAGLLIAVVDSYTAVFFDDAQQRTVREVISRFGRRRDVAWVSLDPLVPLGTRAHRTVQGAEAPERLVKQNRQGGVFAALSVTTDNGGRGPAQLLATAHPSGTRMEWLEAASSI
jgi:hypothetical protein